jgi:hypothetical protein
VYHRFKKLSEQVDARDRQVRKIVPRAERAERFFAVWAALRTAQTAKLSQRRTDVDADFAPFAFKDWQREALPKPVC